MAVRTAYAGTALDGDVYTAANHARMPGGWIGYAQVVAAQAGITAEVDLAGLTVTVTVNANRRIRVTGAGYIQPASNTFIMRIKEGATTLKRVVRSTSAGTVPPEGELVGSVVLTPTAGAHTYKLTGDASGIGSILNAGADNPAFILVEDLGPAT